MNQTLEFPPCEASEFFQRSRMSGAACFAHFSPFCVRSQKCGKQSHASLRALLQTIIFREKNQLLFQGLRHFFYFSQTAPLFFVDITVLSPTPAADVPDFSLVSSAKDSVRRKSGPQNIMEKLQLAVRSRKKASAKSTL